MQPSAAAVTTDELALLPDAIQPERDFSDPANFINRELSWLEFNRRVLEEAQDPTQPLIERVKFMTIFSNNLDEFFEIRVAGIKQQTQFAGAGTSTSGWRIPPCHCAGSAGGTAVNFDAACQRR